MAAREGVDLRRNEEIPGRRKRKTSCLSSSLGRIMRDPKVSGDSGLHLFKAAASIQTVIDIRAVTLTVKTREFRWKGPGE